MAKATPIPRSDQSQPVPPAKSSTPAEPKPAETASEPKPAAAPTFTVHKGTAPPRPHKCYSKHRDAIKAIRGLKPGEFILYPTNGERIQTVIGRIAKWRNRFGLRIEFYECNDRSAIVVKHSGTESDVDDP